MASFIPTTKDRWVFWCRKYNKRYFI